MIAMKELKPNQSCDYVPVPGGEMPGYKVSQGAVDATPEINGKFVTHSSGDSGEHIDADKPSYGAVEGVSKDQATEDGDAADEKAKPQEMVGMVEVFRFGKSLDVFLIILGLLASCIHGAAMPVMIIVFGDMADSFISTGVLDDYWNKWGANITALTNCTKDQMSQGDPECIKKICEVSEVICNATIEIGDQMMDDFIGQMNTYTFYYVGLGCIVLLISYVQTATWQISATRQAQRIRTELFAAILRQEIGWFDTHEVGELNNRLADDVNKIQEGIGDKFGQFFQWFSSFIAGFTVGFIYGWELTLVILSVSPLLAISGGVMGVLGSKFTSQELQAYAKAGAVAEEVIGAIRTVIAFGGQDKEATRYDENLRTARNFGIRKGATFGGAMGMVFFIIFCAYSLAFWYGSTLVREDPVTYTGGSVLIVFFSVIIAAFSIGNAGPNFQVFSTARGAAHIIYGIIDQVPAIDSSSEGGASPDDVTGNVEFRNVKFRYPSRPEAPVLNNLNLKVDVGQTVALVGASGCGKSTTVQLLQRFYDPLEGQVYLDGRDIRELNLKWLRQKIGVVSQEPVLFATSIKENIRYGRDGVTDGEIIKAAKQANAHDFIKALPKGYSTLVGERGAQMSGGQKQRIAIARALVRDPKVLLLDEATSALDTESEATVQAALDSARKGRTTIVIAHRLSTIRTADLIVGISEGEVAEMGTHDELMKLEGIYHMLVTNQTKMNEGGEPVILEAEVIEDLTESGEKSLLKRAVSVVSADRRSSYQRMTSSISGKDGRRRTLSTSSQLLPEEDDTDYDPVPLSRIIKLNAPEWLYVILGCLAAIVSGAIQPMFAFIFSEILGVFSETANLEKMKSDSEFWSLMFLVIAVSAGGAMLIQTVMFSISGERLTMRIRQMSFKALLRQEVSFFDDHKNSVGALTTRLSTDASAVQGATGSQLAMALQALSSITIGLTIGFIYSWELALGILGFGPFILASGYINMKVMMGNSKKDKKALEDAGKVAVEAIENIRTVATLTKEREFHANYVTHTGGPYKDKLKRANLQGVAFGFSQGVIFFAYAVCFRFGAFLITEERLVYEDMYKVITAIVFSAMAVGQASSFAPDYGKAKLSAAKIFSLLDNVPTIDSYSEDGIKPKHVEGNIELNELKFNYPTRPDIQVLRGLQVSVPRGKKLALVGSSGCGKSTTIQLLERFYDAADGKVLIDGHDLRDLNLQWARRQMGLVQQEPILFGTSIRENIAYGDNLREVPMDEIIQAARNANIHEFIMSQPQGYETNVGDKGAQLSGGQKQRVAIARALLRNPTILLLDEATSALDTESEKVVQEALDKAQEGRTCIVIAHRLSTIHDADIIAVVHNGKISEIGSHAELMALQGFYYKLNMTQAKQH